jgi:hypothetical protein
MAMEKHTLPRSGLSGVTFTGELIGEATDPLPEWRKAIKDVRRWHELRLFKTGSGKYVVAIGFRSGLEQESAQETVRTCETAEEVERFLIGDDGYDPLQFLEGFPETPKFEKPQQRLEDRVTKDFESRVGLLLANAGFVEEFE